MLTVQPGSLLADKYRVDRVLGIGGMGMVVAATHLELHQPVALKFMRAELATSTNLVDRFLREARVVARLRGEHVCRIFDVGRLEDGSPYIVMELLGGEDFATLLAREGALEPSVAVMYLLQAIEGVAEAHAEGIVHRDLKPGNLFVTTGRDGTPLIKVLDFGISKSSSTSATRTGEILGSPGYMAPEQMSNAKATDARTDVWALGVILYQALSARMPWSGESLPALCMSVISDPPPPLPAHLPGELVAIVSRCLEKEPPDRWSNVGELARALARFGGADAMQTAARISKIVSAVIPVPTPLTGDTTVATVASESRPVPTPPRPNTTFSSSAAELELRPSRTRGKIAIVGAGVLAAGAVVAWAASTGGSSDDRTELAAAPAPAPAPAPSPAKPPEPVAKQPPSGQAAIDAGKREFAKQGCNACHSIDGTQSVGPTFAGAWGSVVMLADGTRATFDDAYFIESLLRPAAKVRLGYASNQPSFERLTDDEIAGLAAYVRSLAAVKVSVDCTLPGKLDVGGTAAGEYRCSKIDFKTKACRCPDGTFALRTPGDVAICHEVPAGCAAPVTVSSVRQPARPATTTTTTPPPAQPKPEPPATGEDMWMQMTHDKDSKGKDKKP